MTQRARARFTRATRFGIVAFTAAVLMLMNGDRPRGQLAGTSSVNFDGVNDYITFGAASGTAAPGLGVTNFTLELWFNWSGNGAMTSTGAGGLANAIPLITKGRGEGETPANLNMNYFLGISGGKLAADFEDTATGGNHPVTGDITISTGVWHHAAVTYEVSTSTWRLYLDGVLDKAVALPGGPFTPEATSIQHAGLGTAMTSAPAAAGFFQGIIDEARIWNVARSQAQIQTTLHQQLTTGTGLIGRWGLNEGANTAAANSIAGRPGGTLTGGPTWVTGIANNGNPGAPQNVIANAGNGRITIAWNANTEIDISGYNIYRNGSGTPLNGSLLTSPIFTDSTVTNGLTYTYVVRAVDTSNNLSLLSTSVVATPNALLGAGMQFNGTSQYVTFGQAAGVSTGLGAQTFTLETWFKRTALGAVTSTGTGGSLPGVTDVVPLISKGMAEAEMPAEANMNYFLGISASSGRLVADFEDTVNGGNHPITGNTPIPISTTEWHHVAATFGPAVGGGNAWNLYLDGVLDATLNVGTFTPESLSTQHAAIGTALTRAGTPGSPAGFFAGLMDEVRIWNVARSQVQIQSTMFQEVNPATVTGLIGRWALNEASGPTAVGSARSINGTLTPAATPPTWTAGYPFPLQTDVPAAPEGLFAQPGNARVTLIWAPNSETDLAGYNVYRNTSSPVPTTGTPVNGSTPVTSPSYVDLGRTNGTQYFYAVKAIDIYGNSSPPSNEANATPLAGLNQTPVVTAGPDRTIDLSIAASLSGFALDDGPFSVLWTLVSGPGVVNFASATSMSTTATFSAPGTYVLRLTANDGEKSAFDDMAVTVNVVLVGAGDIAPQCAPHGSAPLTPAEAVATLLDGIAGQVFTLGDNAYQNGTAGEFADCYNPTWGRHKSRTRPVAGNHDYNTPNATGYYDYFNGVGMRDGPAGDRVDGGYYSYNLGNWHIVVLNSECTALWNTNGCDAESDQERWLRDDLANSPTNNIIAMWHKPRYSSSSDDDEHAYVQPLWQAMYEYGVDISLGGHWHNYERLSPLNALGQIDTAFGIKTFVIGTGGINLSGPYPNILLRSELRNSQTHGVVKFTLKDTSYDWQFIPITGQSFTDSGTGAVHDSPGNQPPVVDAGTDQTIGVGAAALNGSVTDDGPNTITWSQVSGPSTAVFGSSSSAATSVGFPTAGTYVLQLTVNDGKFVRSDTVSVIVTTASGNLPPLVNVGGDLFVTLPNHASLTATLNDDGFTGIDVSPTWTNQTPAVGAVTFDDPYTTTTTAAFSAPGTYVLRLTATDGEISGFDELTVTVNPVEPNNAIDFTGTNAYVTFGVAPQLGASKLTIEAWFRRDGAGTPADTGSGGFLAVPMVTKGRAQNETATNNMNYFLGIVPGTGGAPDVLGADFEDNATGLNHPVKGLKPVPADGVWHHVAATYDGKDWSLYLDGALDTTTPVGNQDQFLPRSDSIQHASIGSALNTDGTSEGLFNGVIDEVRIWNRALSLSEIQANINQPMPNGPPELVARWGLNETGTTTAVADSTPNPVNGTINGSGWTRVAGAPFNMVFNSAPNTPVLNTPANGATGETTSPSLSVDVSDPENEPLNVTFFGRATNAAAAGDFTIVAIPDTQHYVDDINPNDADGDRALTFTQQTQWIVSSRPTLNTVFVSHLGDIVEHIDAQPAEWPKADASMDVLDAAVPPVPYGIAPGNHDMSSAGAAVGYNQYFGLSRMSHYPWYGGYLGQNQFITDPVDRQNYNQYSLFSAGGMDFVVIHLEYDMPGYAVEWADKVLKAFPNRRAIIATHLFLNDSGNRPTTVLNRTPANTFNGGTPAANVWTNLIVPNCNVVMVLNGHYPGEANRTDATPTNAACPSRTVHQLESDYQSRINGGDGWLRYMTFKPSENKVYVYTYSPKLGQFETDANSQFVLDFNMQGVPFTQIGTDNSVPSGTPAEITWAGRTPNTQYQWYATVSDGNQTVTGPTWSFTTGATGIPPGITTQPQSQTIASGATAALSVGATGTNLSYQWYQGSSGVTTTAVGGNSANFTTPNLTVTTSYWVRVSNAFGPSVDSATAVISIGAAAAITTQPQSQTIASNATAVLTVAATGTALSYQWYEGTTGTLTTLVGSDSNTFTTPPLTTARSYWVRVNSTYGFVDSDTAAITIGAGPTIDTQPQSQTIASNTTAVLSVAATGTGLSYQWYRGSAPDTANEVGGNSNTFTTPPLTVATSYWVRVNSTYGSIDSSTATISIGAVPTITTQPLSQVIASNAAAVLGVAANGTALSYQWYQGSSPDMTTAVGTDSPNFTTPPLTTATNYWVRVNSTYGFIDSATAAITIGVGPAITTHPQDQTIASNATAILNVAASGTDLTYQWYRGTAPDITIPVGGNSNSFTTPNLTTQTSYWVQVSNTFGTVDSTTATISIGAGPTIDTQPQSQTIASGATAALSVAASGTAPLSYQWYEGASGVTTTLIAGATTADFTTPTLTTTTSYWVRVSNDFGPVVDSATAAITIGAGPAIATQPQSQTITSGATANLNIVADGTALSYQWYQGTVPDTGNAVGTDSPAFTTPPLTTLTSYWVRVNSAYGFIDSTTITITIGAAPGITTQPQSETIASGATAALSVAASGTAPLSYQWYEGASGVTTTLIAGATTADFTTPTLTTTTSYWVRVSNDFGPAVDSATATITIGAGPTITTQPQSQTIASNATAVLTVAATGTALSYQWYEGTTGTLTTLVGSDSNTFTTPPLTTARSYWVRVNSTYGFVDSDTAAITIGAGPTIDTQPQSQTIASNTTAVLSVAATGTGLSYQWYRGSAPDTANEVGGNSNTFTTPPLTVATSYWVRVNSTYGSIDSSTAIISIGVGAAITASPQSITIASGATANLSVTATGTAPLTYQWFQGTAPNESIPVGTGASFITPNLTAETSYWVRVSNTYGTADSTTATISIGVGAAITASPQSITIASGTSTQLTVTATGENLTYQWYRGTAPDTGTLVGTGSTFITPNLTTQTSYWVRVSNTYGGANSSTAIISIGVGAAITASPQSITIASGATANLSVTATGTAPLTYQWFQGTVPNESIPVGTGASFITPNLTAETSYWVRVNNTYGTADSTTATISIGVGAAITASPQNITIASGTSTQLTVTATGENLTYQWYRGTAPDTGTLVGTGSTITTPNLTTQTSYWVRVSNAFGPSVDSATAIISIGLAAAINTQPQSQTIVSGTAAALSVGTTGTAPLAYQWYQGASGSTTTPMAGATTANFTTPNLTTTTSYWVRVSNTFGGVNSSTATISIGVGPGITTQPQSQTIASNTTALLTVGTSGANLSYQWYQGTSPDQANPVGTNSASFTTPPLTAQTTYWVRISNNFGGVNSNTATISMGAPVAFTPLGVGTHFPTVDNADQGAGPGPRAITPPAVQLGDLVVIVAAYRGTATLTMTQTGGQLWTAEANTQANGQTVRVFWTQFNGIWTGNPAVTNTTGTLPLTAYSFGVDMAPGTYPEIDVPFLSGNHTGGTVTVPAFNIGTAGALALVGWISSDNNTWDAPTAGWSTPGGQAQWRNSNGSDNTIALAHRIITSAGTTGTIARSQTLNGPDSGLYFRMAFKATTLTPATAPGAPLNLQAAASLGEVALAWADNSTNEFAFQIERCVNVSAACTNFAPLAAVGSNTTSYNDTTVANSTTYRYQVRAVNVLGPSQYSDIADATTPTPPFTFRAVGSHFPTVENADQGGGPGPRAITPPASLQPGDLMVIVAAYRGTATLTMTETGGQVWTSETNAQANGQTVRVFWSQFNGFWTANPAVTNTTGTLPITVYGLAFDMAPGLYPVIDVPFVSGSHAGGTVTVPSFDTTTTGVLALAGWISGDNNTWGAGTTGWSTPGAQAQWRNSNGSDSSLALAYRLLGPAGPSGNVVRAQSASGPDNGLYFRLAFRALEIPSDPPADPSDLVATPSVGRVALIWLNHATNAAGFNIERCAGVNCTNFAPLSVVGPNAAGYNDTTVAANTTYRYQVRAFNLFSPSNYSNIADALTPAPPPPPPVPFTFRAVGTHYPTVDNTNGVGPGPRAVTPPATLQAGDLYVIVAAYRGNTTLSIAGTGGQTWTAEGNTQANGVSARVFWTRFNGTWAGTPSVTNTTGTEALTAYSFAFAMSAGMHPEIDVPVLSGSHSGGSVTVPSFMTNTAGTLVLAGWLSDENNTWSAPTTGWSVPGSQQWRNTQGEDTSLSLAYRVFTAAGPTGSVTRTESDDDAGLYFRLAWKQVPN